MSMNESFPSETCFFVKSAVEPTLPVLVANILTCVFDFLVAITATVGNALIVHVIWKTRALHSASNTLLGCLAVTDLLVGSLVAPFNILAKIGETVNNGGLYCAAGVISSCIGWTSGSWSYLTLALISVERYLAIRLHLRYVTMVTTKRIITIWASFWFFVVAVVAFRFLDNKEVIIRPIVLTTTSLCVGLTLFCYGAILVSVRRHRKQILNHVSVSMNTRMSKACISHGVANPPTSAARVAMTRQKKSTLTMFYILMFYFLCSLPMHAYLIVVVILGPREDDQSMRIAYRITSSLSMMNSALNPALYCLRIGDLRRAVINFVKNRYQKIILGI